jgi:hypothetical protein
VSLLTLFGLGAVTAMLVCYAFEARHPLFILGFAGSCLLGSAYGFLQGAWPFGVVEFRRKVVRASRMDDVELRKTLPQALSDPGRGIPEFELVLLEKDDFHSSKQGCFDHATSMISCW